MAGIVPVWGRLPARSHLDGVKSPTQLLSKDSAEPRRRPPGGSILSSRNSAATGVATHGPARGIGLSLQKKKTLSSIPSWARMAAARVHRRVSRGPRVPGRRSAGRRARPPCRAGFRCHRARRQLAGRKCARVGFDLVSSSEVLDRIRARSRRARRASCAADPAAQ